MWKIAPLSRGDDPRVMRDRAAEARNLAKRGIDPVDYLHEQMLSGKIERYFDSEKDGWTWGEGVEKFLAYVQVEKAKGTYDDYRSILGKKWCSPWAARLLKSISTADVKTLQDDKLVIDLEFSIWDDFDKEPLSMGS